MDKNLGLGVGCGDHGQVGQGGDGLLRTLHPLMKSSQSLELQDGFNHVVGCMRGGGRLMLLRQPSPFAAVRVMRRSQAWRDVKFPAV